MADARAAGRVRVEGKDYVMADGDVVEWRFSLKDAWSEASFGPAGRRSSVPLWHLSPCLVARVGGAVVSITGLRR